MPCKLLITKPPFPRHTSCACWLLSLQQLGTLLLTVLGCSVCMHDVDLLPPQHAPMRCMGACSGGLDIVTRVTRRSELQQPPDRLDTSEYFEQARAG